MYKAGAGNAALSIQTHYHGSCLTPAWAWMPVVQLLLELPHFVHALPYGGPSRGQLHEVMTLTLKLSTREPPWMFYMIPLFISRKKCIPITNLTRLIIALLHSSSP